ncbi:MAG: N-acetylglucosamine-6-phosphate deacetylase [Candidatus Marinimicrobia bacterium]|nr:N-acetylglucosamine-6-phosphate deacetylase [Candidatus Neomarinimicrobiota bacterium]MDD5582301.1 N-acetylglucosamine-6-phosphate deacetylase [Candidatus Neomarinimicrobiota bacterium]
MNKTVILRHATIFTGVTVIEDSSVVIVDNKISDVLSEKRFKQRTWPKDTVVYDMEGSWVSSGFVDTHIHGINGYDTSDGEVDSILGMSQTLVEYGVTGFCPTLYPQSDKELIEAIRSVRVSIGIEPGAKIYGIHMEGPFLSKEKPGVLPSENMKEVDLSLMDRYIRESGNNIAIMTVAPELKNMHELALYCTKKGIVLSAGHSNATYENMLEGIQAGILHSTHFFNAMRRLHHRDPGVVGAIMIHHNVSCEIIADSYHLHPAIIKLLREVKPINKIILVTDSLKPTEQKSGILIANNEEVYYDEGVFKRKTDGTIAGSALTMIKGVKNLVEMGFDVDDALRMASCNPVTVISRQIETGYILPGRNADITSFDNEFRIKMTMIHGEIKYLNMDKPKKAKVL